jgi:carbamate kinase
MPPTVLIAIGGNALMRANEPATSGAERTHVAEICCAIADVVSNGWRVVITHGNGPQVGAALLRSERAAAEAYPLPLDLCVASTQGEVGYLLQQTLGADLQARGVRRPIATVVAQIVVDAHDPAFARPTKPIGPFYSDAEKAARQARGWTMVEEPPHGWRRVVPSPEPLEIVEESVIRALVEANVVVITLGGGGIPVVRNGHGFTGVEAVVDKDLASALLAKRLQVDRLVLATDVDRIYLDFGTPRARGLDEITTEDLRRYAAAGQFPAGSMGPKVESALRFVESFAREAIVCSLDQLRTALAGRAGTRIVALAPDRRDAQHGRAFAGIGARLVSSRSGGLPWIVSAP